MLLCILDKPCACVVHISTEKYDKGSERDSDGQVLTTNHYVV